MMEEKSAVANDLTINVENTEGPHDHKYLLAYLFNDASTPSSNQQPEGPKIPKVPKMLRDLDKNKGCFDPRVVSIGPYHHGEPQLEEGEKLKTKLARLHRKSPREVAILYERVKNVASDAREFYDKEGLKNIDNEAFTKMMFIDGCFILEFIIMCLPPIRNQKEYHPKEMITNDIANVKRDLFLLENQLPYIVLKKLMAGSEEHNWEMRIKNFITICRRFNPAVKPEDKSPLHLLHMMMARFVIQSATVPGGKSQISETADWRSSSDGRFGPNKTASDGYFYHPARVLKSIGIKFRPNKTGSFSDVKFEPHLLVRGMLTLPPIRIDASTRSLLLNLLAFESSCDNNSSDNMQQGVITSYMCFMDSLIDSAEDVMILRTQKVINNCLGNDQLVADLFNEIASNLVPNPHTYAEAKHGIQKHCENRFKEWMAECHHNHFRNPWTLLALFGSLLLITLTAAQTYLAAMQLKQ
ncbi:UPF0481 protein At3g47200-like [Ziziphus jujuba]|uniref:UPF0481 protein At3g47200-like n=1 Tax=Ziziphus jujuba TaxID=326968 RepID=A0ABM3IL12_ZIZJJ|nr:UPF0481 protein At3g47200-like [Ziziphus jujuba]